MALKITSTSGSSPTHPPRHKRLDEIRGTLTVRTDRSFSGSAVRSPHSLQSPASDSPLPPHPFEKTICAPLRESVQILDAFQRVLQKLCKWEKTYSELLLKHAKLCNKKPECSQVELLKLEIELLKTERKISKLEKGKSILLQAAFERAAKMERSVTSLLDANKASRKKRESSSNELISVEMLVHELRTPLLNIRGFLGELLQDPSNSHEHIKDLNDAYRHLAAITDRLGQDKYSSVALLRNFGITELVSNVKILTEHYDKRVGLVFHNLCQKDLIVSGDFRKITQVLVNLISNAIKYSPKPGTVHISIEPQHTANSSIASLTFKVTDQGPGIPLAKQSQLFQSYSTLQEPAIDAPSTGLGLYLSSQFVKEMGGTIGVQSKEQEGSAFFFTLELAKEQQPDLPSPIPLLTKNLQFTKSNIQILAAEDDTSSRKLLGRYFIHAASGKDSTFTCVSSGEEAVTAFQEAFGKGVKYDIVILDMHMLKKTGWDSAKEIYEFVKAKNGVFPRILFLTGNPDEVETLRKELQGVQGFETFVKNVRILQKPYDKNKLIQTINKLISNHP